MGCSPSTTDQEQPKLSGIALYGAKVFVIMNYCPGRRVAQRVSGCGIAVPSDDGHAICQAGGRECAVLGEVKRDTVGQG